MAVDPELQAETHAWLLKAATDLRAAETLLSTSPPLFDQAVFHCQQAAEKALKAFLTWSGCVFRKTHNLEEIGEQCVSIDPSLREIVDRAVPLTEYAWKFRYPGGPYEPTAEETVDAIAISRAVLDAVLGRLPSELKP